MRVPINLPLMCFSLLISLTLWLVVFAQDLTAPIGMHLKVRYVNLDKDNYWVDESNSGPNQDRAYIKFQGPADKMQELTDNPPVVEVDLSNPKTSGVSQYPATLDPKRDLDFYVDRDKGIWVRAVIERRSRRTVRVEVRQKGTWTDQTLSLDLSHISRRTAEVEGPESLIVRVRECIAYVDVGGLNPTNPAPVVVPLEAVDSQNRTVDFVHLDPTETVVTPFVTAAATEKTVVVSPNIVGQAAPGYLPDRYDILPSTVKLSGDPAILANMSVIQTDPIDVNGLTRDRTFRQIRLRAPLHIQAIPPSVTIRYRVKADPSFKQGTPTPAPPPVSGSAPFPSTVPPLSGSRRGGT